MADPILVARLALRLQEMSEATPKGEGFWPAVAEFAANEIARTVTTTLRPVPPEAFVALLKHREGFEPIARDTTLAGLATLVSAEVERRGQGTVWLVEVKRIVEVTG